MFALAHLSDLHLPPTAFAWRAAASKRLLGYLSYRLKRKKVHDQAILATLASDLRAIAPDHIAITGDLTTIALPDEFTRVRQWLHALGPAGTLSVVPGNHDAYVRVPWEEALGRWAEFMSDDAGPTRSEADFPFVRRCGPIAIVGVSSASPCPLFYATGRIGAGQLARLAQRLEELGTQPVFRVVLMHHPPWPGAVVRRKRLLDQAAFRAVIRRAGAELILHGHHHRFSLTQLTTPQGAVPVIGVPSGSASRHGGHEHARYHLCRLAPGGDRWRLEVEVRAVADSLDRFTAERRFSVTIPTGGMSREPPSAIVAE